MPQKISIPSRKFTSVDSVAFATLSGDFNPLHVDQLTARRTVAGGLVVHGIHLLLWALDQWSANHDGHFAISNLNVSFSRPVLVGVEVSLALSKEVDYQCSMVLFAAGVEVATISLGVIEENDTFVPLPGSSPPLNACNDLSAADLPGRRGNLSIHYNSNAISDLFPRISNTFPAVQLASLLASTRLVGVECPGLHSLYSEINLIADSRAKLASLGYIVSSFDARFNLVTMLVEVPGMSGEIKAFLRPGPVRQPCCAYIRAWGVEPNAYANQRALVVGGSRGLGEVIAKTLAMGGADVALTYYRGQDEADAVVADIFKNSGRAISLRLDVTAADCSASIGNWLPTHLYYMATPHIVRGKRGVYSPDSFSIFCSYYVEGFARLLSSINSPCLQYVYYPSSIFLDEQPLDMVDYISAKSAGEALFRILQKANPTVRFVCSRLPRVQTDQSNSLIPVSSEAALPVVLNQLKLSY